jgi:hypothetical protein
MKRNQNSASTLARLSATVDPSVLEESRSFAALIGFKNSYSAFLNDLLDRDNKQRRLLLSGQLSHSPTP